VHQTVSNRAEVQSPEAAFSASADHEQVGAPRHLDERASGSSFQNRTLDPRVSWVNVGQRSLE
jgi:hypothetical protein